MLLSLLYLVVRRFLSLLLPKRKFERDTEGELLVLGTRPRPCNGIPTAATPSPRLGVPRGAEPEPVPGRLVFGSAYRFARSKRAYVAPGFTHFASWRLVPTSSGRLVATLTSAARASPCGGRSPSRRACLTASA